MDNILFLITILFSILLPLWLYLWINKVIKTEFSSRLDLKCNIPSVHYLLKRWWAEFYINMKKKEDTISQNCEKDYLKNSKNIKDKDSCNSMSFYGADQKGNSLFIKFSHRGFQMAEVSLQLITSDGRIYVLSEYPETTFANNLNQEWTAAGIKIESLQFQQRWRIIYNGMLRNLTEGDECVEHIRLNCIFIAFAEPLRWPDDWSSKLHAEALAREPWKTPQWINKIKQLDYTGFDQWGSLIGQITYKDASVSALYLRGLHQHRWGKHECHEFHKCVTLFGVMKLGAMYYISTASTKHSFSQIQFGQFRSSGEKICKINNIGLDLIDFTQEEFATNMKHKMWFIVDDIEYNVLVNCNNPITLYHGQPWNWENKIATAKLELNGKSGVGLLQLWQPCDAPCQMKTPVKLQFLKQLSTYVEKNDYILNFDDGKCQNENIVGGKGFSLAMLTSIKDTDFTVPKGFCVTVFALELQLHTHRAFQNIVDDIENISVGKKEGNVKNYCNEAAGIIESIPVVEEVRVAIIKAIEKLESADKSHSYAIRSSAVGEDSDETSAAGQNSTFLGVRGADNIVKHVVKCWASLFSYQSVKYRQQHGLFTKASMGVCVQEMVNPDTAGVMFTRHPTTGDPSNIVITANYGLGETVVSAMVEPDTIIVHKSWDNKLTVKDSILGNKKQKIQTSDGGVVTINLDDQESNKICMSEEIALRLAVIGLKLETLFSSARDIEWAVAGEKIYLLQARPITTLYTWTDFELTHELDSCVPNDVDILTFANMGEVCPSPMSPLSRSVIIDAFNSSISTSFGTHKRHFIHVVGMRNSVDYYNTFLREPNKTISLMNKVGDMAICGTVIITPEMNKIALEKNGEITSSRKMRLLYQMIKEAINNGSIEKIAREANQKLMLNEEDFHSAYSLYNEINQHFPELMTAIHCHMHQSRVNISFQMVTILLLTQGYEEFEPDHFSDIAILLGSCSDVVSTEVMVRVQKIVTYIKKSKKDEEFKKIDPLKAIDWLKINCPLAEKELQSLLKDHGYRCIQEIDFMAEPWSLRPENLIMTLQTMMASQEDYRAPKKLNAEETVASLKMLKSKLSKWLIAKLIPYCRQSVARREFSKAMFVHVVHKFRLAYRRLGKLMVLEGYLPSEDLIFFLTNEEIGQVLNHRKPTFVQKACRRKRIYPQLKKLEYPEFNFGMPVPVQNTTDMTIRDENLKIQGTSVCGGSVLSRACVITALTDAQTIQQGDILITHSTDIAWSPYFPLLSGVVTELGGLISHGAVVAREYGLPCIIGAKKATQVFQTGDTVLLVANAGVLQLVKKCDEKQVQT